jgi:chromosome partitioning protein
MRSIAIINQKGGVGKTTSTTNLAAALANCGQRVLAIDLDPQAHLTINLGAEPRTDNSVYALLTEQCQLSDAMLKVRNNLWLVPSSIDLAGAEVELVSVVGREVILRDAIEPHRCDFDFMLIDCPPSLGMLTVNALTAVTEVFIPLQPHFLALQGLGKLLDDTIRLVAKRVNPHLRVTGVILTMFEGNTKLATEVVEDVKDFFASARGTDCPWANARVFDAIIRRNIKLAEAPSFGLSIFDYEPRCNGALDYARLAEEVLKQGAQSPSAIPAAPSASLDSSADAQVSEEIATPGQTSPPDESVEITVQHPSLAERNHTNSGEGNDVDRAESSLNANIA